jgi:hypothetical protein
MAFGRLLERAQMGLLLFIRVGFERSSDRFQFALDVSAK